MKYTKLLTRNVFVTQMLTKVWAADNLKKKKPLPLNFLFEENNSSNLKQVTGAASVLISHQLLIYF